jgi:hypothetical protein
MRNKLVAAALVVVLVASPGIALAQEGTPRPQPGQALPGQQSSPSQQPLSADLGISLDRVRKQLRELPPVQANLLRYDFHVDVYGENPKVDFFKDFDLSPNGSVRYGGMTHAEFLDVTTPQAFKAPSADLIGFAVWAASQLARKKLKDNGSDKEDDE